jgi:hypothetical protein
MALEALAPQTNIIGKHGCASAEKIHETDR